jgi:hypothetical protein
MSVRSRPSASVRPSARPATPHPPSGASSPVQYVNTIMENIANDTFDVRTQFSDFFPEGGPDPTFFKQKFADEIQYNTTNKDSYQTLMGRLQTIPGFVRVISQNMHCRDRSWVGTYSTATGLTSDETECEAIPPAFYDDQRARTTAFIESIQTGELSRINPDILAIQEMQEYATGGTHSRKLFESVFENNPTWGVILPLGNAKMYKQSIPSGLGFVYNKTKMQLIKAKLFQFPTEFSSGIDAGTAGGISFKGVLVGEFQHKATGKKVTVFNIHPSPYVDLPDYEGSATPRATLVDQIVQTHIYQCLFISLLMKKMYEGKQKPTILLCGDWNINKFLSNGTTGFGNKSIQQAYEKIIEATPQQLGGDKKKKSALPLSAAHVLPPTSKKCFKEDAPYIGEGVGKGGNPKYCDTACCGAEIKTVYEILQAIPPAHLQFIQEDENEAIVPFGGKYTWDALFNSVMYSPLWSTFNFQLIDHIVYSRYGAIPSFAFTKVRRLTPTTPIEVSEGLLSQKCIKNRFNKVYNDEYKTKLRSFIQASNEKLNELFQMNHIKFDDVQRILNTDDTETTYNYLDIINNIIKINKRTEDPNDFTPHLKNMYMGAENQYYYYDFADHYAIECVLILEDNDETIESLDAVIPGKLPFTCWKDTMIDRTIINQEMFPRKWFDCSLDKVENLSGDGINVRLPEDLNGHMKRLIKTFISKADNSFYNNSVFFEDMMKRCLKDFNDFAKAKEKPLTVKTPLSEVEKDIKAIIDRKYNFSVKTQNETPFTWYAEPIKSIDVTADFKFSNRKIQNAALKFFNRFLEREIINRNEYGNMQRKFARKIMPKEKNAKLYTSDYDKDTQKYNTTKKQKFNRRKSALDEINRGITRNIRNIIQSENRNKSISYEAPAPGFFSLGSVQKQILHKNKSIKPSGGYRTTRKRKHQKRHTRKH